MPKQYVVTAPDGTKLSGVKELFEAEAEYFAAQGYALVEYEPCIHPGVFANVNPYEHCFRCGQDVPISEL